MDLEAIARAGQSPLLAEQNEGENYWKQGENYWKQERKEQREWEQEEREWKEQKERARGPAIDLPGLLGRLLGLAPRGGPGSTEPPGWVSCTTSPALWRAAGLPPIPPPPADWRPCFLRFGEPPPGGNSRNYLHHYREGGLSVYRVYETPEGGYVVDFEENLSLATQFEPLSQRKAYLVDGPRVGTGGAGEPLLSLDWSKPVPPDTPIRPIVPFPPEPMTPRYLCTFAVATALPHSTKAARESRLHGPLHWLRVALNGLLLAAKTPGADGSIVLRFAAFHDARRLSDGRDPDHGRRVAKAFAEGEIRMGGLKDGPGKALLLEALARHADGEVTDDPTIGVCWDADRLDLGRCGITPDPAYLSTEAAKKAML